MCNRNIYKHIYYIYYMELKEYNTFEKKVIKKIREKYKVDSYLKVVKNIIRIVVEEYDKLNSDYKKKK